MRIFGVEIRMDGMHLYVFRYTRFSTLQFAYTTCIPSSKEWTIIPLLMHPHCRIPLEYNSMSNMSWFTKLWFDLVLYILCTLQTVNPLWLSVCFQPVLYYWPQLFSLTQSKTSWCWSVHLLSDYLCGAMWRKSMQNVWWNENIAKLSSSWQVHLNLSCFRPDPTKPGKVSEMLYWLVSQQVSTRLKTTSLFYVNGRQHNFFFKWKTTQFFV